MGGWVFVCVCGMGLLLQEDAEVGGRVPEVSASERPDACCLWLNTCLLPHLPVTCEQLSDEESAAEQLAAWRHGLVSDSAAQWRMRYHELLQYQQCHGDAHVGYREGDDPELSWWVGLGGVAGWVGG